mmetsp:Transcript_23792/g.57350  ORF Transcript_23792/g.57350 Transcript_23792/m.57350 type:complete len:220 (+) Transcript_23792:3894-4553(+)
MCRRGCRLLLGGALARFPEAIVLLIYADRLQAYCRHHFRSITRAVFERGPFFFFSPGSVRRVLHARAPGMRFQGPIHLLRLLRVVVRQRQHHSCCSPGLSATARSSSPRPSAAPTTSITRLSPTRAPTSPPLSSVWASFTTWVYPSPASTPPTHSATPPSAPRTIPPATPPCSPRGTKPRSPPTPRPAPSASPPTTRRTPPGSAPTSTSPVLCAVMLCS